MRDQVAELWAYVKPRSIEDERIDLLLIQDIYIERGRYFPYRSALREGDTETERRKVYAGKIAPSPMDQAEMHLDQKAIKAQVHVQMGERVYADRDLASATLSP